MDNDRKQQEMMMARRKSVRLLTGNDGVPFAMDPHANFEVAATKDGRVCFTATYGFDGTSIAPAEGLRMVLFTIMTREEAEEFARKVIAAIGH